MANANQHEEKYRGSLDRLAKSKVVICGVGALGSNLADNLLRQGFADLTIIDFDRVEDHNIGTQRYGRTDVGAVKVEALRNLMFRTVGVETTAIKDKLTKDNAKKLLKGAEVLVDCFDNSEARQILQDHARANKIQCLHAGLNADYAEVIWDDTYKVPKDADEGDSCEYPMARNIIMYAVVTVSEALVEYLLTGVRRSHTITLKDRRIREESVK